LLKVIELVTSKTGRSRFDLGYTIACNRSQSDLGITNAERNVREDSFFKTTPWNAIPEERTGVKALKDRLNKLLVDVTRQNFRAVAEDVRSKIQKLEKELERLGPARETSNDQRNHLIKIAADFREITGKAIDSYYGRDPCFQDDDTFRLATNVMAMNNAFSEAIACKGFTRKFRCNSSGSIVAAREEESEVPREAEEVGGDNQDSNFSSADNLRTPPSTNSEPYELFRNYPELKAVIGQRKPEPEGIQGGIMQWITEKYNRSKGFEIGTLNPSLLPSLFLEQSRNWRFYASSHVEDVIQMIHKFNYKVLHYCCKDTILAEQLWAILSQDLLPLYKKALDQVIFLIDVEQHGNLITMNHYFADNLRKAREDRIRKQLFNLKSWATNTPDKEPLLRLEDTVATLVSNEGQSTEDLHDTLEAYYKVARKRFVDAVCLQAVDHFLVSSKKGPLWLFSPQLVGTMSDTHLASIAGEGNEAILRRARLLDEITNLKAGQRILAR